MPSPATDRVAIEPRVNVSADSLLRGLPMIDREPAWSLIDGVERGRLAAALLPQEAAAACRAHGLLTASVAPGVVIVVDRHSPCPWRRSDLANDQ